MRLRMVTFVFHLTTVTLRYDIAEHHGFSYRVAIDVPANTSVATCREDSPTRCRAVVSRGVNPGGNWL